MLFKSKEYELKIYDGYNEWSQNELLHRPNGPAFIFPNGRREWRQNGSLHRLDGPAIIRPDGYQAWWENDKRIK